MFLKILSNNHKIYINSSDEKMLNVSLYFASLIFIINVFICVIEKIGRVISLFLLTKAIRWQLTINIDKYQFELLMPSSFRIISNKINLTNKSEHF